MSYEAFLRDLEALKNRHPEWFDGRAVRPAEGPKAAGITPAAAIPAHPPQIPRVFDAQERAAGAENEDWWKDAPEEEPPEEETNE